jgi:hypothetical protein
MLASPDPGREPQSSSRPSTTSTSRRPAFTACAAASSRRRRRSPGVDGEVAAACVAQVILGVRVVAGGDRADSRAGAIGVDEQQEPLEEHVRV